MLPSWIFNKIIPKVSSFSDWLRFWNMIPYRKHCSCLPKGKKQYMDSSFAPMNPSILSRLHVEIALTRSRFSAAIEPLLTSELIKRNRACGTYSIDRTVQTSYRLAMTLQERQHAFDTAVRLLSRAFPQMDLKGQLYGVWAQCAEYIQHLISLADSFIEERQADKAFRVENTFCELINQGQR